MKKRNYSLDFLKLLFALAVALFHLGIGFAPNPLVMVDTFYLLAGFFLGRKFYSRSFGREESYTGWDYTLGHIRGIYPQYFAAMMAFFLYILARALIHFLMAPSAAGLLEIGALIWNQIPDALMLQSAYHFHDSINYPAWTVSAMVIGGYFLYTMLCRDEKLTRRILIPASAMMVLSLLSTGIDMFGNQSVIYIPLLRSFAFQGLGVLTWYTGSTGWWKKLSDNWAVRNITPILAFAGLALFSDQASIYLVTVPLMILCLWDDRCIVNRLLNREIFRGCGKLSIAVYLNHALFERIVKALILPRLENAGIFLPSAVIDLGYLAMILAYSLCILWLIDVWQKRKAAAKIAI